MNCWISFIKLCTVVAPSIKCTVSSIKFRTKTYFLLICLCIPQFSIFNTKFICG
uniref:Uncharacterized protein n=1 Tax=Anguilla anguilla TaxID=7936 RepID=A0A0E9P8L7_ANGAN